MIDLHTHTCASDGSMTAVELVRHAKENGIEALAVTDHDGVGSVRESLAEGARIGLEVIPGIEFSCQHTTECHMVGLFIDPDNAALQAALDEILRQRMRRNVEYTEKLGALGMPVSIEEARAEAGGSLIARAHYAKAMVRKGYVSSVKEAFDKWLGCGKPAYSSAQAITPEEGVELINGAGGVAYVAHLHQMKMEDAPLFDFLRRLKDVGLAGVEGWYTEYTPEMEAKYQAMAKELGLGLSGGTDFHAAMKPHIRIGVGLGNMNIPYSVLEAIKAARDARG